MTKIVEIVLFIVLFAWQLPQNLVGLCIMPFMGKMRLIAHRNYCFCFEGKKMLGGISLGSFAFVSRSMSKQPEVIAHEIDGHTVDSKIFGPLYIFIIGIPSLLWAKFRNREKHPNYYVFYTEKRANNFAGVESVPYPGGKYYHLVFKNN